MAEKVLVEEVETAINQALIEAQRGGQEVAPEKKAEIVRTILTNASFLGEEEKTSLQAKFSNRQ